MHIETDRRDDAVLIPRRAVIPDDAGPIVFVVEDSRAARRPVTLGVETDTAEGAFVEVLQGILAGAPVIVAGHTTLEPGTRIVIENTVISGTGS